MQSSLLSILFILDFSGSMSQNFEGQIKSDLVKKEINQALQNISSDSNINFLYFGTEPKLSCHDIKLKSMKTEKNNSSERPLFLSQLQPGAFGKTPLAKSIEKMPNLIQKNKMDQILILTDGADTCGGDPCAALLRADQELSRFGYRDRQINVNLIGFDLTKEDQNQLQCMKELKNQLKAIKLDVNLLTNKNEIGFQVKKNMSIQIPKGMAALRIAGSTDEFKFSLSTQNQKKQWTGDQVLIAKPGPSTLTLLHPSGKSIRIDLKKDEVTSIPLGRLVIDPKIQLKVLDPTIHFVLVPTEMTVARHPHLSVSTRLDPLKDDIYFGEYTTHILNPEWIKSEESLKLSFALNEKKIMPEETFFKQILKFVNSEFNESMGIIEINSARYLLAPKTKQIPLFKTQSIRFLKDSQK